MARAREQGAVRGDITGTDIVLLLGGIHRTAAPLLSVRPRIRRRCLEPALDGPSASDARALPHRPHGRLHLTETPGLS